jgi:hypothetical protein
MDKKTNKYTCIITAFITYTISIGMLNLLIPTDYPYPPNALNLDATKIIVAIILAFGAVYFHIKTNNMKLFITFYMLFFIFLFLCLPGMPLDGYLPNTIF